MAQSPIVKYGIAGIIAVVIAWGYDAGSATLKEMVSMPLVEEIKTQTRENVRPIPASLQTLYLVQINDGDLPMISSSVDEPLSQIVRTEREKSVTEPTQPKTNLGKSTAPRILASTEAGAILSDYGFVAKNETIQAGVARWKLTGSLEAGYTLSSI